MATTRFTQEELILIQKAVRHFQIHGAVTDGREYNLCSEVLEKTSDITSTLMTGNPPWKNVTL